jgi:hypothetical protein
VAVVASLILYRLSLVLYVVVLEEARGIAALKRSWTLSKGIAGPMTVIVIFAAVVGFVLSLAVQFPLQIVGAAMAGFTGLILQHVGGAIGQILAMPIGTIAFTLLYYDSRIRKEGFDLEVMAQDLGLSTAPAPPTAPRAPKAAPPPTAPAEAPLVLEEVPPPRAASSAAPRAPAAAPRTPPVRPRSTLQIKVCPKCATQFPPIRPNCPKCGTRVPYR